MTSSFFFVLFSKITKRFILLASMEEKLHHRVKALMKEQGMTQRELAKRSGLTEASVCKYLSGSRLPHSEAVVLLAKALGTTSDYLLGIKRDDESVFRDLEKRIIESKENLSSEEKMRLIMLLSSK